jgi:hypothetical protein
MILERNFRHHTANSPLLQNYELYFNLTALQRYFKIKIIGPYFIATVMNSIHRGIITVKHLNIATSRHEINHRKKTVFTLNKIILTERSQSFEILSY